MDGRQRVFISYSHDDTRWLREMKQQLAVFSGAAREQILVNVANEIAGLLQSHA